MTPVLPVIYSCLCPRVPRVHVLWGNNSCQPTRLVLTHTAAACAFKCQLFIQEMQQLPQLTWLIPAHQHRTASLKTFWKRTVWTKFVDICMNEGSLAFSSVLERIFFFLLLLVYGISSFCIRLISHTSVAVLFFFFPQVFCYRIETKLSA